jgi:branched-chain amino acid transport system substrate-binding protein
VKTEVKPAKPAIIYPNDEYGKGGYNLWKQAGVAFAAEETFNQGDKDVSAQMLKLKAANPDAIVLWSSLPSDAGLITNQIRQLMPDVKIIGSPALAVDEYYKLAQEGADGSLTVGAWVPDLSPESEAWAKRMKAADPDMTISFTSAENYDAAKLALEAIKTSKDLKPESIRQALAAIKNYQGITGVYSFDERGDGLHSAFVVRWNDGKLTPVEKKASN